MKIPYASNIDKSELEELPLDHYTGEIDLIYDPQKVAACIDAVTQYSYVGFDTETKPVFRKVSITMFRWFRSLFQVRSI